LNRGRYAEGKESLVDGGGGGMSMFPQQRLDCVRAVWCQNCWLASGVSSKRGRCSWSVSTHSVRCGQR